MTIVIVQACNGCGKKRDLTLSDGMGPVQVVTAARRDGWREADELGIRSKHLCPECLKKALDSVLKS